MKTTVITLALILILTCPLQAQSILLPDPAAVLDEQPPAPAPEQAEPTDRLVRGNTRFALDLYNQLADKPGFENLFFSPFSISVAMAMVCAGAEGQTADQIAQTLHFPSDEQAFHVAFGQLASRLNEQTAEDVRLRIANALWLQRNFAFRDAYLDLVGRHYDAALEQVDFQHDTEAARERINAWVEEKTNDKITDLIPPGMLSHLTRLVLTNAVYFKGDWARQFDPAQTQQMPFTLQQCSPTNPSRAQPNPEQVDVPMMHQEARFPYAENQRCQILRLPYAGDALSMVILLPKADTTLCQLTDSLTAEQLESWISRLEEKKVDVYLPRFEMNYTAMLKNTLASMGMPLAFTPDADLSGIADADDLHISSIIHKAYVKVNEEGTEAAAATGVTIGITAMPAPPPVFRADRPFLFLIRDNTTGTVLFLGRLTNPNN